MRKAVSVTLTRRRFLAGLSAGVVAVALEACSFDGSPTVTSVSAPPTVASLPPTMSTAPSNAGAATTTGGMTPATGATGSAASAGGMATAAMPLSGSAVSATRPVASASAASGTPTSATSGSATAGMTGSATSSASPAPVSGAIGQTLTIKAMDYAFQTTPNTIPGGLTTIQMQNLGKEPHQAQLVRLKDGVTYDQFVAALKDDLKNGGNTSEDLATSVGGPNVGVMGATIEVIQDLKVGQYALLCFVPNAMGVSHVALGMTLPLTVTAPTAPAAMPPAVNGTITLKDDNFDIATFPAGRSLYRVVNAGAEPADLQILGVAAGNTVEDVKQYVIALGTGNAAAGPIPATGGAGISTLAQGESGIIVLNLTPGEYAVWTRDPTTGVARFVVA